MKRKTLLELTKEMYNEGRRLVVPLMGFPGVELTGSNIKLAQQNCGEHYKAIKKLVETFSPDMIFPLMDLSVEANALGRYTIFPQNDSATVPKVEFDVEEIETMRDINITFDMRLTGFLETMRLMSIGLPKKVMRGSYVTGPFTLSALIMGADETVMATIANKDDLHSLCALATEKIQEYVRSLISAGAQVICVLEPSSVMLGPDQFWEFSASYVNKIAVSCKYNGVDTIYHTCGNTMHLIEKMVESGVSGISLDSKEAGVDLPAVAEKIQDRAVVIGNINPTNTMLYGNPEDVKREVTELMDSMKSYPCFILSTGCDLPQEVPLDNIQAFMDAGRSYNF